MVTIFNILEVLYCQLNKFRIFSQINYILLFSARIISNDGNQLHAKSSLLNRY